MAAKFPACSLSSDLEVGKLESCFTGDVVEHLPVLKWVENSSMEMWDAKGPVFFLIMDDFLWLRDGTNQRWQLEMRPLIFSCMKTHLPV